MVGKLFLLSTVCFVDEAKYYVKIFTEVGRLEQIQTYYSNCHKVDWIEVVICLFMVLNGYG